MIDFDAIWRFQDEVRTVVNSSSKREQKKSYLLLPSERRIERSSTACLGDCICDLNHLIKRGQKELAHYAERENGRTKSNYNPVRQCIELELARHLDDEELSLLSSQLTLPADYDGEGTYGSMFVIYPW